MKFTHRRKRVAPIILLLCSLCVAVSAGADGPTPISVLKNQNMYERLGLKPGATTAEIKKAYGDFRRANAAAINSSDPAIQDRAGLIGEAFQKLRKEESRRAYDGAMGFDDPEDSKAQASPADDYARRQKPLSVADEELIAQLYDIPDGPLRPTVQKQIFGLLDSKTIDPRVADEVTNVLFRVGEWDQAIWAQVDEKFEELSGRWRDLSFAIENQKQWPPNFANKVRLALDPGAGAMTQTQIHQAELKRDLAVDLFLSRKKSEIPPTVLSALDADLSTPHTSSSFKSALPRLLRLEKKEISRTKAMDEKLMAAMKKIFRQKISAAGGQGPYPNEIIHVFVQSRELPKGLWEVLREEAATAADAGPVITAADILAQRHDMPEDVKTVLYRRIADARTRAVPQTFNRGDGTTKVSLEFFHLDSRNIQHDAWACKTVECAKELVRAFESSVDFSNKFHQPFAQTYLEILETTIEKTPNLMDDEALRKGLSTLLERSRRASFASNAAGRSLTEALKLATDRDELHRSMAESILRPTTAQPKPVAVEVPAAQPGEPKAKQAKCASIFSKIAASMKQKFRRDR